MSTATGQLDCWLQFSCDAVEKLLNTVIKKKSVEVLLINCKKCILEPVLPCFFWVKNFIWFLQLVSSTPSIPTSVQTVNPIITSALNSELRYIPKDRLPVSATSETHWPCAANQHCCLKAALFSLQKEVKKYMIGLWLEQRLRIFGAMRFCN